MKNNWKSLGTAVLLAGALTTTGFASDKPCHVEEIIKVLHSHLDIEKITGNTKQHYCTLYMKDQDKSWYDTLFSHPRFKELHDNKVLHVMLSSPPEAHYYRDFTNTRQGDYRDPGVVKYVFMADDNGLGKLRILPEDLCTYMVDLVQVAGDNFIHMHNTTVEVSPGMSYVLTPK